MLNLGIFELSTIIILSIILLNPAKVPKTLLLTIYNESMLTKIKKHIIKRITKILNKNNNYEP